MIKGIEPSSETYKDTKKMLFSLGEILTKNDPSYVQSRLTYQEFLNNPSMKKKAPSKNEQNSAEKTFNENIRFIEH